jgi:hypothetical protein
MGLRIRTKPIEKYETSVMDKEPVEKYSTYGKEKDPRKLLKRRRRIGKRTSSFSNYEQLPCCSRTTLGHRQIEGLVFDARKYATKGDEEISLRLAT